MAKLKEYVINVRVHRASGSQSWIVQATSAELALESWQNGEGVLDYEEYEEEDYGKPEVVENI